MKHILITGAGSYLGKSLGEYLRQWENDYEIRFLSLRGDWESFDFHGFDAVYHTAALVHHPETKDDPEFLPEYLSVNRDLCLNVAKRAKQASVRQFLFLSTEAVYGLTAPYGKTVTITKDTPLGPKDNYGRSKLEAEQGLAALEDEHFRVAILRPPIIYGKGCTGNFRSLQKFAEKMPCFPKIENRRSMLYVGNLNALVKLLIDREDRGIFCPQDREYLCTSQVVRAIAAAQGKRLPLVPGFSWSLYLLRQISRSVDKAFGSLCYDQALSAYPENYQAVCFPESIQLSVNP